MKSKAEIIAFLNSDGGTIYVGVDDDGSIVGIKDDASKDKVDLKLGNWIQEAFFPKPSGLIQYYFNSDDVLVINISKGINKPYYLREKDQNPQAYIFVLVEVSVRLMTMRYYV